MKDAMICLRISKHLRSALERMSEMDRRSLSSTVQNILYAHIEERGLQDLAEEKRHYLRKRISAPALLSGPDGAVHAGMVRDISLGGICVAAPGTFRARQGRTSGYPLSSPCRKARRPWPCSAYPGTSGQGQQVHVGASFIDDGCQTFEAIRRHFVN